MRAQNPLFLTWFLASSVGAEPAVKLLPEIQVTGAPPADAALHSGWKSSIPLEEISQAITVIPPSIAREQGSRRLEDVLLNAAGVSTGGDYSVWDYYRIRGFDASTDLTIDGLYGPNGTSEELWNIERVEVLKGPSSHLLGQGSPGGFVNLVSKKPEAEAFSELQFTAGSWDFFESAADLNIPLHSSSDGARGLFFRLNALYRHENSFVDFAGWERAFFAPSLRWQTGPDTSLTFLGTFKKDRGNIANALPASGTIEANPNGRLPSSRYSGNPFDPNTMSSEDWYAGLELEHEITENLHYRHKVRYTHFSQDWKLLYPDEFLPDDGIMIFIGDRSAMSGEMWQSDATVEYSFDTGPAKHVLLGGLDYFHYRSRSSYRESLNFPELDLFYPDYGAMEISEYGEEEHYAVKEETVGLYIQDHIRFPSQISLTLGGRQDWHRIDGRDETSFSPKAGVTWEFQPGLVPYASYSQSFRPQRGAYDADGNSLSPESGENLEAGIKFSTLNDKLKGQFSLYQLTRQDIAISDLTTADPFDAFAGGEQRARGVELEFNAELLPELLLTGAYTYTRAKVTEDTDLPIGSRLPGVPEHALHLWLRYSVPGGPLEGFGAAVGTTCVSSRPVDYGSPLSMPGYAVVNAALFYEKDHYTAALHFNNITDKDYYSGAGSELRILPGMPFNVAASLSLKF